MSNLFDPEGLPGLDLIPLFAQPALKNYWNSAPQIFGKNSEVKILILAHDILSSFGWMMETWAWSIVIAYSLNWNSRAWKAKSPLTVARGTNQSHLYPVAQVFFHFKDIT